MRQELSVIQLAKFLKPDGFERALSIESGREQIAEELPAVEVHVCQPNNERRASRTVFYAMDPIGPYDLVVATDVLYRKNNWRKILDIVKQVSSSVIIISGVTDWLVPEIIELGKPVITENTSSKNHTRTVHVFVRNNEEA